VKDQSDSKKPELLERLKMNSFPPAAFAGAFASFASAALGRTAEKSKAHNRGDSGFTQISLSGSRPSSTPLELQYTQKAALPRFSRALSGVATDQGDRIIVLADGEVRTFNHAGSFLRGWKAPESAACIRAGRDERIYIGAGSRVEILDNSGNRQGGFEVSRDGKPGSITALKTTDREILIADAAARMIHRYDFAGKRLGEIGTQNKAGGFMLPNRSLDIDVNSEGFVLASDPGRHRVSLWTLEGTPVRHFGKFGMMNPEDFVGCCNPVNLAFSPGGRIVTAEKVIARVKVYDSAGKLLALIGPEHFDARCTHLYLAVDSRGRILVGDPMRLEVKIFSAEGKPGGRENL
jgi:hypothetical protein